MIEKELTIASDFPPVSYDKWRANVVTDLKGVPFDNKLVHRSLEGFDIQPLYTANDWPSDRDSSGFPGFLPLTRGSQALGHTTAGWDIRQEHLHPNPADANKAILEDLEHGVTSIQLRLDAAGCSGLDADAREAVELCGRDGVMAYSLGDFESVLNGQQLDIAPASIDGGAAFLPAAALLAALLRQRKLDPTSVRCTFNADPLGALMSGGQLNVPLDVALDQMADLAAWTATFYPQAAAVRVSTAAYHHAGATTTQDLAFAMATAVEYLRAMSRCRPGRQHCGSPDRLWRERWLPVFPSDCQAPSFTKDVGQDRHRQRWQRGCSAIDPGPRADQSTGPDAPRSMGQPATEHGLLLRWRYRRRRFDHHCATRRSNWPQR